VLRILDSYALISLTLFSLMAICAIKYKKVLSGCEE